MDTELALNKFRAEVFNGQITPAVQQGIQG